MLDMNRQCELQKSSVYGVMLLNYLNISKYCTFKIFYDHLKKNLGLLENFSFCSKYFLFSQSNYLHMYNEEKYKIKILEN